MNHAQYAATHGSDEMLVCMERWDLDSSCAVCSLQIL